VLYLRWCGRTGRSWQAGLEQLALFVTWLRHVPAQTAGADVGHGGAEVVAGPGGEPARGARRVNAVLTAVRAFVTHAVASGRAPGSLLPLIYEVADARDLPDQARGEDGRMRWRLRARHRLREPGKPKLAPLRRASIGL
jgi:integrase/recombinase XerD